jgi:hypothetical protein
MNTAEKIYKTVQGLPEPTLHEVLDFAKFFRLSISASSWLCFSSETSG